MVIGVSIPKQFTLTSVTAVLAAAYCLSGCARATVGSEVNSNGTWTRTVQLHGPPPDKTGGMMLAGTIDDAFAIPKAPWTVTRTTEKDGVLVTCKRTMKLGETASHDVVCKAKANGKVVDVAVNECSVTESSPGMYTYREVIHWIGPKPKYFVDIDSAKTLKEALPPALATDASVRRLADDLAKSFMGVMLGPPDPLITEIMSQMMMSPDLALHKIAGRLGDGLDKALQTEFGDRMTADQRRATVRKLVESVYKSTSDKTNVDPTKGPDKDNASLTALTFSVKLPGKIVSSNGLSDKLTNEVYWGLYPESASLGQDVVLTATCQVK